MSASAPAKPDPPDVPLPCGGMALHRHGEQLGIELALKLVVEGEHAACEPSHHQEERHPELGVTVDQHPEPSHARYQSKRIPIKINELQFIFCWK
jgi:hypothetical protein